MKIEDALKLSDVAVSTLGTCVTKSKQHDWYHCGGHTGAYSIYELAGKFQDDNWQPAYVRPQFEIGDKVSFLQACLSGHCFVVGGRWDSIRRCVDFRCVDLMSGQMKVYNTYDGWINTSLEFCPSTIVTIVADPSQEQPEKRQRTRAEILADIKTLVSELESARSE